MPTRHAEIGAINALTYKGRQCRLLKKTTLVVIRFIEPPPKKKIYKKKYYNKVLLKKELMSLQLACSRPCSECIKIIRALRIKSVIFVNEENELINMSPDDIHCTVHSGGTLGVIQKRIT